MSKLTEIINGWKGYLKKDPLTKEQLTRAIICSQCPFAKKSFLPDDQEQLDGMGCSKCLCPLPTKIRSNESECPMGYWEPIENKK